MPKPTTGLPKAIALSTDCYGNAIDESKVGRLGRERTPIDFLTVVSEFLPSAVCEPDLHSNLRSNE